jgi:hypothetical protein
MIPGDYSLQVANRMEKNQYPGFRIRLKIRSGTTRTGYELTYQMQCTLKVLIDILTTLMFNISIWFLCSMVKFNNGWDLLERSG